MAIREEIQKAIIIKSEQLTELIEDPVLAGHWDFRDIRGSTILIIKMLNSSYIQSKNRPGATVDTTTTKCWIDDVMSRLFHSKDDQPNYISHFYIKVRRELYNVSILLDYLLAAPDL